MSPQKTISPRAWIELLLLALIWGASFLSIRVALDEIGPLTIVAHRVLWAMLMLWSVVFAMRLPLPRGLPIWGAFLMMGLLNNVVPFVLMAWGQQFITSGLTSILNAATAVFGVLATAVFFADERISPRKALGVTLGFAGVVCAIGFENLRNFDIRSLAQLAVIGGTVSYALASVWARKKLGGQSPQVAAAGMLTGSALVMVPLAWVFEGPMTLALQTPTLLAIAYFALPGTALAYLLYYRVLAMAGSGNLMLVTLLIPPVAITLGALLRDETMRPAAYGGFALLALGLLVLDGRVWRLLRAWGTQGKP
ncbi:EamA domain-containing membrane protein RarD [Sulfitobacter brevis]|uniref:EamA domain-containing membrane protein RarD n=1 Tax=Sulfitobacter brevis TaxID=74348 RepID=A0A1I1V5L7_9RHOB|nr:DMT family transporter [Sulfitobacter brevis]SFD75610.1 EamA domain-containing membrane protein RarD [Sulfitobacter brevis]